MNKQINKHELQWPHIQTTKLGLCSIDSTSDRGWKLMFLTVIQNNFGQNTKTAFVKVSVHFYILHKNKEFKNTIT